MILTRSTRLTQPQGPVEVAPEWGGRGAVYLPPVQSNINRVAGTVGRGPTPQGISAIYTAGAETKVERLNGSAPNGVTEFTQIVYLTPIAGGVVNDRGIFGNWNTTGATSLVQLIHRARDATTNGRYCYVVSYDPTSGATAAGIRTIDYSAVDNVPALLVATVKNNTLSLYLNGVLHGSTAVAAVAMSGQAELQIGNYYDNAASRRLSANVHLAAFLPRGLGGSEVAALSRNPWQLFRPVQRRVYFDMGAGGGAATSVSTELAAEYKIQSTVHADGAGAYTVRSVVAADTSPEYSIRGAISSDVSASYIVRALAQADIHSAYLVRVAVQADAASTFTVRGSASSDATAAYLLRGSASSDLSAAYDIQTASGVSSSVSASYVVRGAAQSDAAAAYDLRKSVGANSEHAFMVRGLVSSDLGSAYEVQAALMPVYADIAASYSIEGPVFGGGLSPTDIAAIRAAVRSELSAELTAVIQIQTKVDAAL
jgi:hypothetical protein